MAALSRHVVVPGARPRTGVHDLGIGVPGRPAVRSGPHEREKDQDSRGPEGGAGMSVIEVIVIIALAYLFQKFAYRRYRLRRDMEIRHVR